MGLVISSAATNTKLVDIDVVRTRLGLSAANDDVLEEIIEEVSSQFDAYLRRYLAKQTYVETLQGSARQTIVLSQAPVVSISSVTYGGDAVDSSEYSIVDAYAGMLWRDNYWTRTAQVFSRFSSDLLPGTEQYDWVITYVAGYVLPPDTPGASDYELPAAIRRLALTQCQFDYATRRRDPSVVVRQAEDFREEYAATRLLTGDSGLLKSVEHGLAAWRLP
jgi:hypothetical protein